jgi:pimeloyl-ACP methyl ester carboxylesterase
MATFVLVHGAFVGGWCWRWVADELRAAGHDVLTPTLTGHGQRAHLAGPEIGLDTHIQDVVNVLICDDLSDVVLVGWSYGGMVVAGVADRSPERISRVVFLDSDVPKNGETSVPPSQHDIRVELAREHGDGWRVPPEVTRVEELLLGPLPAGMREWVTERLVPHQLAAWIQPIRLSGAGDGLPTDLHSMHGRLRPGRRGHAAAGRANPQRAGLAVCGVQREPRRVVDRAQGAGRGALAGALVGAARPLFRPALK